MEHPFTQKGKAVLFDLDRTLFDHQHSLETAIEAIQNKLPQFSVFTKDRLIEAYDSSLQQAYNLYVGREISYQEKDTEKFRLLYAELGLPEPNQDQTQEFKSVYRAAYRASRRATPGSIETLAGLKRAGWRLAIVTNGQTADQIDKAEAIGVANFIEVIITSEDMNMAKPNARIFDATLDALNAGACWSFVVGDDLKADIQGAINQGILSPIWYNPMAEAKKIEFSQREVTVIRDMRELLPMLCMNPLIAQLHSFRLS